MSYTIPAVDIISPPIDTPPVVHENVRAALTLLEGALLALDRAGYEMEHIEGGEPYGAVFEATALVIQRAHPNLNGEDVLRGRLEYSGGLLESLDDALASAVR